MSQLLKQLTEKRNVLLTEMSTIALGKEITVEQRTKFSAIQADVAILEASISAEKQNIEEVRAIDAAYNRPPRAGFGNVENPQAEHEKRAFFHWMRTGSSVGYEQRDLGVGTPVTPITGGNVLVPTTIGTLIDARKNIGSLLNAVNVLRTNDGHQINIPLANDTANGLVLVSQATNTTGEVDPTLSSVPSNVDTAQSGVVKISNELLEDSYFDLEAWISQKLVTRFVRGFSKWISQGNGSNVAALAPTAGPTTTASGVVGYADLVALYGSVDAAYANDPSACFVMSSATRAALMNVSDNFGHPLFQLTANGTNPPFQSIFGAPIVIDESAPALAAGNKPISFGLASEQYTARIAGQYQVKRLSELFALSNETAYVLYARVSGVNTDAGTHPMKSLTIHA